MVLGKSMRGFFKNHARFFFSVYHENKKKEDVIDYILLLIQKLNFTLIPSVSILDYALIHHCFGYLHESCDIRTFHVVYKAISICAILGTLLVDRLHDCF